jgi:glycolate oxidase FAD binding subunit
LRDLIIGITVALPDGTLARGGGIVVKNVSGYDMMRLHFGALGSLGVIIQANFKVLPAPEAQRTLLLSFRESDQSAAAALTLRTSQLAPTALVVLAPPVAKQLADLERWVLAARCEGPEGAVERQVERLRASVETASGESVVLDDRKTLAFWSSVQGELEATPFDRELRVRIGELPSRLGELAARLERRYGSALRSLVLDSGSGLAYATVSGEPVELRAFWGELRELGRHATLLGAPIEVKAGEDVFGRHPEGIPVMRRLKETFDPERILNRGRFIAHL